MSLSYIDQCKNSGQSLCAQTFIDIRHPMTDSIDCKGYLEGIPFEIEKD